MYFFLIYIIAQKVVKNNKKGWKKKPKVNIEDCLMKKYIYKKRIWLKLILKYVRICMLKFVSYFSET